MHLPAEGTSLRPLVVVIGELCRLRAGLHRGRIRRDGVHSGLGGQRVHRPVPVRRRRSRLRPDLRVRYGGEPDARRFQEGGAYVRPLDVRREDVRRPSVRLRPGGGGRDRVHRIMDSEHVHGALRQRHRLRGADPHLRDGAGTQEEHLRPQRPHVQGVEPRVRPVRGRTGGPEPGGVRHRDAEGGMGPQHVRGGLPFRRRNRHHGEPDVHLRCGEGTDPQRIQALRPHVQNVEVWLYDIHGRSGGVRPHGFRYAGTYR